MPSLLPGPLPPPPAPLQLPYRLNLPEWHIGYAYPPVPDPDDKHYGWMGTDSAPTGGYACPYFGEALGR